MPIWPPTWGRPPFYPPRRSTPRTYEETRLETKDKLMPDDVTVRKIPRYEVSNDCGGVTLIMGDEYFNG